MPPRCGRGRRSTPGAGSPARPAGRQPTGGPLGDRPALRRRGLVGRPLVEAAACALREPGTGALSYAEQRGRRPAGPAATGIERRLGEAFACTPLVELGVARAAGTAPLDVRLRGVWRGSEAVLRWVEM